MFVSAKTEQMHVSTDIMLSFRSIPPRRYKPVCIDHLRKIVEV